MPRRSIEDLPSAARTYRGAVRIAIESEGFRRREDLKRAQRFKRPSVLASPLIDEHKAAEVAELLQRAGEGRSVPNTLASACYVGRQRLRLFSSLWQLIDTCPLPATTFTLVPSGWCVQPTELHRICPQRLMSGVRSDLTRCGAAHARGAIFLALDGEFEPRRRLFQPHAHGVAIGEEMIACLDQLRKRRKYQPEPGSELRIPVKRPVRVRRQDLDNLPDPLTYLLKLYWPCRWVPADEDRETARKGRIRRIPEPYHSECLLWLNEWSLSDITLMIGMYVGARGFALSSKDHLR